MPPHAPSPGQVARSIASSCSRVMSPVAVVEPVDAAQLSGQRRAGVEEDAGQVEPSGGHEHAG